MGYTVQVHDTPVHLFGYHGDRRAQQAHVVIPRQSIGSASNDVGFEALPDGTYRAHISEYDASCFNRAWRERLMDLVGVHTALYTAAQQGLPAYRTVDMAGCPQVIIQVP